MSNVNDSNSKPSLVSGPDEKLDLNSFISNLAGSEGIANQVPLINFEPSSSTNTRRSQNLPEEATRLYGEAAVTYARGCRDEAKALCLEVVKLAPSYAPAYQLLASICEDEANMEGYLQYQLVAAHLTPDDYDLWLHLADIVLGKAKAETGDQILRERHFQLAQFCLKRASKVVPPTFPKLSIYERYLVTLENKPVKQYQVLQQILGDCTPQLFHAEYMDAFRSYANHSSNSGDLVSAVNALLNASFYSPEHFTRNDIDLLVQTAFTAKMWKHVAIFFSRLDLAKFISSESHESINLGSSANVEGGDLKTLTNWIERFGDSVEIDERKLSLFHLSRFIAALLYCCCPMRIVLPLVEILNKRVLPRIEGLVLTHYLAVARAAATVTTMYHELVCQLVEPLLGTRIASLEDNNTEVVQTAIEINLWYANAKTAAGQLNEAASYYKAILEAAPQHIHVRQALADVFSKLDNRDAAISVLVEKFPLDSLTPDEFALRLAQCSVLSQCAGCEDAFVEASTHLLFGDKCDTIDEKTLTLFASVHTARLFCSLSGSQTDDLDFFCQPLHAATMQMPIRRLNIPSSWYPQIWQTFEQLCEIHYKRREYFPLFRLLIFCFFAPPMYDYAIEKVRHLLLVVSFSLRKWEIVNTCVRSLIRTGSMRGQRHFSNSVWNLLAISSTHLDDMRAVTRSISRILGKKQSMECDAIHYMLGHASFVRGNYRVALTEYGTLISRRPTDPMAYLMAGLCFMQLSANRFRSGRPLLVFQAMCCFERYRQYRGECQEVAFNIGRAFHHIGFTYIATDYYKRCLELPPVGNKNSTSDEATYYDLRPEAAYNLSQICRRSGSIDAARYYTSKFCVVE